MIKFILLIIFTAILWLSNQVIGFEMGYRDVFDVLFFHTNQSALMVWFKIGFQIRSDSMDSFKTTNLPNETEVHHVLDDWSIRI